MAYTTLACRFVSQVTAPPFPVPAHSNQILLYNQAGVQTRLITCDPDKSEFLPVFDQSFSIDSDAFQELWPWLALMLLTAFGIRRLLKVFDL